MTKNIEAARRALAAVDVSSHVERVAEAAAEQQRLANAIEDGRAQLGEIGRQIMEARQGVHVDAEAAGDSLLAGEAPPTIDVDGLRAQQEVLKAGMTDLRRREEGLAEIQHRARGEGLLLLSDAAAPLIAEAHEMAQSAAEQLAAAYAAAEAIQMATGNSDARLMAERLRKVVDGLVTLGYLPSAPIAVPSGIVDALKVAEPQIDALRRSVSSEVRTFAIRPAYN